MGPFLLSPLVALAFCVLLVPLNKADLSSLLTFGFWLCSCRNSSPPAPSTWRSQQQGRDYTLSFTPQSMIGGSEETPTAGKVSKGTLSPPAEPTPNITAGPDVSLITLLLEEPHSTVPKSTDIKVLVTNLEMT